jgi:hypothetical protein
MNHPPSISRRVFAMKVMISICISLLMVGSIVTVGQSAGMDLAGAWLFDEGSGGETKDSVGGNDGEIQGDLKWVDGKFGKGLEFPGRGDSYVSIPHEDVLDSDPYTITAWTKLKNTGNYQYIAWQNGLVWPEPHAKRHTDIWVMNQPGNVVIMWSFEGGADYGRIDGKTIVADDTWHHVAKSSDGDMMRLFIDGKLDGEAPVGGKLIVNGEDPLWIGARPGDVAATGIFDEVGFFTKALSEDELAEVMDEGLAVIAAVEPSGKLPTTWGELKSE